MVCRRTTPRGWAPTCTAWRAIFWPPSEAKPETWPGMWPRLCRLRCWDWRGSVAEPEWRRRGAWRARARLGQVGLELRQDGRLGQGAHDAFDHLPVLEHHQGGDAHHTEPSGDIGILIDIHLHDFQLTGVFHGQLVDGRGDHPARPAPGRPEIHQDRDLGVEHFLLETLVRDREGVCHGISPRWNLTFRCNCRC